jgi:hypothetical protein
MESRTPHLLKYIENNAQGYRVAEYRSDLTGHYIGQYLEGRRHGLVRKQGYGWMDGWMGGWMDVK